MQLSTFLFVFFPLSFHGRRTCKGPKLELYVSSTMAEKIGDRQKLRLTEADKDNEEAIIDIFESQWKFKHCFWALQ